jgi:hypothetical protein
VSHVLQLCIHLRHRRASRPRTRAAGPLPANGHR